jgi:hypothetical protein
VRRAAAPPPGRDPPLQTRSNRQKPALTCGYAPSPRRGGGGYRPVTYRRVPPPSGSDDRPREPRRSRRVEARLRRSERVTRQYASRAPLALPSRLAERIALPRSRIPLPCPLFRPFGPQRGCQPCLWHAVARALACPVACCLTWADALGRALPRGRSPCLPLPPLAMPCHALPFGMHAPALLPPHLGMRALSLPLPRGMPRPACLACLPCLALSPCVPCPSALPCPAAACALPRRSPAPACLLSCCPLLPALCMPCPTPSPAPWHAPPPAVGTPSHGPAPTLLYPLPPGHMRPAVALLLWPFPCCPYPLGPACLPPPLRPAYPVLWAALLWPCPVGRAPCCLALAAPAWAALSYPLPGKAP